MTGCAAWLTLSGNATKLLLAVWRRHNGTNNGEIAFAVRESEPIGLTKDQASRAFKELVARGFLKMHRDSAFTVKKREARTWELTAECCGGKPASKDFMKWSDTPETKANGSKPERAGRACSSPPMVDVEVSYPARL